MGLNSYCPWISAFRITGLVRDSADFLLFPDPALAIRNFLLYCHANKPVYIFACRVLEEFSQIRWLFVRFHHVQTSVYSIS